MKRLLFWCISVPLTFSIGSAAVLYNNGLPNQVSADDMTDTLQADAFTVSAPATATSFEFWDVEGAGAYNGNITWLLYTNASGLPGTVFAQGSASGGEITRTSTGNTCCGGFSEFDNVVNMTTSLTSGSLTLAAGTYWLALHDGALSNTAFQDFYWETSAAAASGQGQDLTTVGAPWISDLQGHAFNISGTPTGAVPEPATWLGMSLGLTILGIFGGKAARKNDRRKV